MKDDTISRAAALSVLNGLTEIYLNNLPPTIYKTDAVEAITALPPAQPERKKGEWALQSDDYHEYYECDQCGIAIGLDDVRNFCPNCGADMRRNE